MYEIVSIGDSAFLHEVINAVAMITGSGDFVRAGQIGLLLGVLLVCFQAIINGASKIEIQKSALGWVVFSILFGSTSSVVIVDAYTGQARTVDNVPLGIAAAGGTVSKIGTTMTSLFETGFSLPAMTQHGFGSSLETMKAVRLSSMEAVNYGTANAYAGGQSSFNLSWTEYVMYCTSIGLTQNSITAEKIYNTPDAAEALKWDSQIFTTNIYRSGGMTTATCSDAFPELKSVILPAFLEKFKTAQLAPALNLPKTASSSDVDAKIGDALAALGSTVAPNDFITAAVLQPLFERAVGLRAAEDDASGYYATMIKDAQNQRAVTWMAESSLFRSIVQPMMAFVEGFIFAITPVMGFLVTLGPMGITIVGKYLLMLLWVQMWTPVMSIVNLYIQMTLAGKLSALEVQSNLALNSMAGILQADSPLQKYLATAEAMAASVPMLTMVLAYGGTSIAATAFARKLQSGGDFVDEKRVARDAINSTPITSQQSQLQRNPVSGLTMTGTEDRGYTYSFSDEGVRTTQAARSALETAQTTHSDKLSTALGRSISAGDDWSRGVKTLDSYGSSNDQTSSALRSHVDSYASSFAKEHGLDQRTVDTWSRSIKGGVNAGQLLGAAFGMVGAGPGAAIGKVLQAEGSVGQTWSDQSTNSNSLKEQFASGLVQSLQKNEGLQATLRNSISSDLQHGETSLAHDAISKNDQKEISSAAQDVEAKQRSYQESVGFAQKTGNQVQIRESEAVNRIARPQNAEDRQAAAAFNAMLARSPQLAAAANDYLKTEGASLRRDYAGDEDRAFTAAAMRIASGDTMYSNRFTPAQQAHMADHQDRALAALRGRDASGIRPPEQGDMARNAPDFGQTTAGARPALATATPPSARDVKTTRDEIRHEATRENFAAPNRVLQQHQYGGDRVNQTQAPEGMQTAQNFVARESLINGLGKDGGPINDAVRSAAKDTGLSPDLIKSVIAAESGGRGGLVSPKGATGYMQLLPETFQEVKDRHGISGGINDPNANIAAGSRYLNEQVEKFGLAGGLAAYNMGPGAYAEFKAGARGLPKETADYVDKIAGAGTSESLKAAATPSAGRSGGGASAPLAVTVGPTRG